MLSNRLPLIRLCGIVLAVFLCLSLPVKAETTAEDILNMEGVEKIPGVNAPIDDHKRATKTNVTPFFVKGWIAVAANEIFAFDASTYQERRKETMPLFTEVGAKSFFRGLDENYVKHIGAKGQTVKGYIVSPITLLDPEEDNGIIYWEARFDYVIEYISNTGTSYQFLNVDMEVRDESDEYDPKLGINRWRSNVDSKPIFCPCNTDNTPKKGETLGENLKRRLDIKDEPMPEEPEAAEPAKIVPLYERLKPELAPDGPEE
jgi:hypothetical protein